MRPATPFSNAVDVSLPLDPDGVEIQRLSHEQEVPIRQLGDMQPVGLVLRDFKAG